MAEQTYHGGCHCGAVRYSAALDLEGGTIRCNCSLCAKTRAWLVATPADKFTLESGGGGLIEYRWTPEAKSEPNITYYICETCGVRTHGQGIGPISGARTVAVQVATIEDADPDVLANSIKFVDGLHDAFDRPPADTRLL